MKTKKQQQKPKTGWRQPKMLIGAAACLAGVVVLALVPYCVQTIRAYQATAKQADMVQIRELIRLAASGAHKNAPVDPRTGDVYFPESRLFLPHPDTPLTLTYLQDTGDTADSQSSVSVSTNPVQDTEALYSATDIHDLFNKVPKFQACQRGIKLVYTKFPASDTQNQYVDTVQLQNSKTLYIYVERACPELMATAKLFTNVRSY